MSYSNKVVLVTGGAGFIGSHFSDYLIKNQVEKLIVVDNLFLGSKQNLEQLSKLPNYEFFEYDIADYQKMNSLFREENVDVCFNFAVLPLPVSLIRPHWTFMENVKQVSNITKLLFEGAFETLIHISSSEAYGSAIEIPMEETHILRPTTPYAASKSATDHLVISYYESFNLDVSVLRPFNNYGPRQNDREFAGVIPYTMKRIIEGKKPIITGDGSQTRDYVFVKDTVDAIGLSYFKPDSRGEVINIASNSEISILEIINKISEYMDYEGGIQFIEDRVGDVKRHLGSNEKCRYILDYIPQTEFNIGLKITVDAYLKKTPDILFK